MINFLIKESLKSFRRTKPAFVLSIFSTSIGVLLIQISFLLIQVSDTLEVKIKERFKINIFLIDSISENSINEFSNQLKLITSIESVEFISKENAAQNFIKETGEDFRNILDINPLPASFAVKLKSEVNDYAEIKKIIDRLKNNSFVSEVDFQGELFNKILSYIKNIQNYIFILTAILVIVAFYLVYSTLKLIIQTKNDEIETMKLVGGTASIIRMPIIFSGLFIGIISSILNTVILAVASNYFDKSFYKFEIFQDIGYNLNYLFLSFGPILGLISSFFATRKINLKI